MSYPRCGSAEPGRGSLVLQGIILESLRIFHYLGALVKSLSCMFRLVTCSFTKGSLLFSGYCNYMAIVTFLGCCFLAWEGVNSGKAYKKPAIGTLCLPHTEKSRSALMTLFQPPSHLHGSGKATRNGLCLHASLLSWRVATGGVSWPVLRESSNLKSRKSR